MENTDSRQEHGTSWYRERTDYLTQFMLPERLDTLLRVLDMRTRWMTVCMENTFHSQNASAIIRSCVAFGVQDIHTVETLCPFSPNADVVKGSDKWIDICRHADTSEAIASFRKAGYRIIATTPHSGDISPEAFDVTASPFVVFFGTEHAGVSDEVIAAADGFLRIPMCGFVESLNVSASASIVLYMLSQKLHGSAAAWRLGECERQRLLLEWMTKSIRGAETILDMHFPQ